MLFALGWGCSRACWREIERRAGPTLIRDLAHPARRGDGRARRDGAAAVAVMGAGSVGCWVGGRLPAAGTPVLFVGRPRVLERCAHTACS